MEKTFLMFPNGVEKPVKRLCFHRKDDPRPPTASAREIPSSSREVVVLTEISTGLISQVSIDLQSGQGRYAVWLAQGARASGPSMARRTSAKLMLAAGFASL